MEKKKIIFRVDNPYEKVYPQRRVVPRETLDFIKYLRNNGLLVDNMKYLLLKTRKLNIFLKRDGGSLLPTQLLSV